MDIFAVFLGGGIGAVLRFLVSLFAKQRFKNYYWGTFIANILGCFFLGFVTFYAAAHSDFFNSKFVLFLTTGVMGGFTTFSTFSLENIEMLQNGKTAESLVYMSLSLALGILSIYAGYILANYI